MIKRISYWFVVLTLFAGVPSAVFAMEWHVTMAPGNPDLLQVTVLVEKGVHDVWFRVIFLDRQNEEIGRRDFIFSTDPDVRFVEKGKHQRLYRHGVQRVASVEGDFLEYTTVTGAVFAPAPGQPPPTSTLRRVTERVEPSEEEPTADDESDDE